MKSPFRYFRTLPEIIRLAVMMYVRFPLSLRHVEDLLHERGIEVSHETIRFWWNRFGPILAAEFRNVSAVQSIFDAIEAIALHWESYSLWCSNTIRTARSRTSREYLLGLPMMTPILSSNGVSGKPGEVHLQTSEIRAGYR